ncbi:hypothetical protein COV11_00680 [Candidatus Woesearchaeota archaeon CG10_big_fil_rev_8_21_14_0_10_30_7]|nr:MAG: hypothetical protein COV11_00680 [Candidatus Woesearchaeota archaeon CG10_big_fil_rev_8_21_14_0_10_30_7]
MIFKTQDRITGLTTAATLWTVSAIGMLVGFGMFKIAVVATALVLFLLVVVGILERKYFSKVHGKKINSRD